MHAVRLLDGTESLIGRLCLPWSTDNDIDYAERNIMFDTNEPPAAWFVIVECQGVKSVVQVVTTKNRIEFDELRKHSATHRLCLKSFITLGAPEDAKYHDKL